MNEVAINSGSIVLLSIVFYFVIKNAVKNGINMSMLFSDKQREVHQNKEIEEINNAIKGVNKKS